MNYRREVRKLMYKEYDENREKLAELVFEMRTFTEDELTERFSTMRHGNIEIGRLQTIHDYLDDLRELGVLGFEEGRYYVHEKTHRLDVVAA